ncbi:hypothetical protein C0J52_00155 [Blattella germanica]|nr:hypothetical protein C0J52_00155 [Blattella germanica]
MIDPNFKNHREMTTNLQDLETAIKQINQNLLQNNNAKSQECESAINSILKSDLDGCLLVKAVAQRDYSAVETLIKKGINLNGICEGTTALHKAVENNDVMLIEDLLHKGINRHVLNADQYNPLQLATKKGYDEAVKLLLDGQGTLPKDKGGNSPIHLAAASGRISTIETLIKMNPGILESRNDRGETPLLVAAANGHQYTFNALVQLGADISAYDSKYNTVLHKAVIGGNDRIVDYVTNQAKKYMSVTNHDGNVPIHLALQAGKRNIVKKLIRAGSDLNIKGEFGNSVLHFAAEGGLYDYVNRLINTYHFAVNIQNKHQSTPLHKAASSNRYRAAMELLNNGADPNAVNYLIRTPLHTAAMNNATDVMKVLCDKRAYKDAKDYWGKTPSNIAADNEFFKFAYEVEQRCRTK